MTTVRTAKSKGSQFEYDVQYSLSKIYPDIYRTSERGFQRQYDLHSDNFKIAVECKRLKGISWNALRDFYINLAMKSKIKNCYVIFQCNRQPCLVFQFNVNTDSFMIMDFEDTFGVPFLKHPSTRAKR